MLKDELKKLLSEILKIPEDVLIDSTSLSIDLGVDSISILRLICLIEDKYDIEIDQDQLDLLDNLDSAYKYINTLILNK